MWGEREVGRPVKRWKGKFQELSVRFGLFLSSKKKKKKNKKKKT
jgi:hypothetical protein